MRQGRGARGVEMARPGAFTPLAIQPVRFVPLPSATGASSASNERADPSAERRWDAYFYVGVTAAIVVALLVVFFFVIGERAALRGVYGIQNG